MTYQLMTQAPQDPREPPRGFAAKELRACREQRHALKDAFLALPSDQGETDEHARLRFQIETIDKRIDFLVETVENEREAARYGTAVNPNRYGDSAMHNPSRALAHNDSKLYAAMFGAAPRAGDFAGFDDYLGTLHAGLAHPGLVPVSAGMNTGTGVEGGFLVPPEFTAQMLDAALESEIVRPRCRVEPMASSSKTIGGFDFLNRSAAVGGVVGQWVAEGNPFTEQKAKTRLLRLDAKKLGIIVPVSNELLADGADFEAQLGAALVAGISWFLDEALLTGTGAGSPRGVLHDPALIAITPESGQPAGTIVYENLKKMFARLHPASVQNSVWVANSTAIPQLLSLVQTVEDAAGTDFVGGSHIPVLREDGRGGFTLLTRPVLFTEKLPALGTKGDILLCDFSQYTLGLRQDMVLQKSMHAGFGTDETYYRIILRGDGVGRWAGPSVPRNGDTQSWCVALADRT